jgi:PAS domain S-box-containing protein
MNRLLFNINKPIIKSIVVFVLVVGLTQYLTYQRYVINKESKKQEVLHEINSVKDKLKTSLKYSLSATKTLAFIVENYGYQKKLKRVAKDIFESSQFIDALELTQKGVITNIYPLKGNENIIGYDILKDSLTKRDAYKAIGKKELYFAGPLTLKQGGTAIIGRLPIFRDTTFLGFSVVIIKLSTLLNAAGIDTIHNHHFIYQISKINSETKHEEFFLNALASFNNDQAGSFNVPDGEWKIYVKLKENNTFYDIVIFSILGIILSFICALLVWILLKQPENLKKLVEEKSLQLLKSEKHFRALIEKSNDAIVLLNKDGKVIYQSPSTERIIGYSLKDMQTLNELELIHPDHRTMDSDAFAELVQTPGLTIQRRHQLKHKNGHYIWIEGSYTNLLEDSTINAIVYNYHDVTLRLENERKIVVANRLYHLISCINQLIVHVSDERTLFKEVCHIAVDIGKFRMAWIGMIDKTDDKVIPIEFAGTELEYLTKIKFLSLQNIEQMNGPTARAVYTKTYVVCNDIANDTMMKPWVEEALLRGYRSSIALPIIKFEKVVGTFNLYASTPHYFDDNEIELLEETVRDISFTLENFEKEKKRKQVEEQIIAEKNLSDSIINSLPGIFYLYDRTGKFLRWNKNFEIVSGYSEAEIKNMHPLDFYAEDEKEYMQGKIELVFKEGQAEVEANFYTKNKEKIAYYFNGHFTEFNGEKYLIGMGIDITLRKKVEFELRKSEARLEEAQSVVKVGSCETDLYTMNIIWSEETYRIFDISRENHQASHPNFLEYVHPEDKEKVDKAFVSSLTKHTLNKIEHRIVTPSGDIKIIEERWRVYHDNKGTPLRAIGTCKDITESKKIDEAIRQSQKELRQLSTYLQTVREEERTHIAREIHDELGQQLTALKMDAYWVMKKNTIDDINLNKKLLDMIALIDDTIMTVRRISSELRPSILDDLGLISAIEWQAQEFERRTGVKSKIQTHLNDANINRDLATNIFRVYQEALTNITRHAKATEVETTLNENENSIILIIKDNGLGFDVEEIKYKNSLGLVGMKERALLFKGELNIISEKLNGTTIILKIPKKIMIHKN